MNPIIFENVLETLCDADDPNRHWLQNLMIADTEHLAMRLEQSSQNADVA